MDDQLKQVVNYLQSSSGTNSDTLTSSTLTNYCQGCSGYHYSWWPSSWCNHKDSFKIAFQIVSKLMEKKLISLKNIGQFVELVNDIEKLV